MNAPLPLLILITGLTAGPMTSISAAEPDRSGAALTDVVKEVLRREDGQDRHWIVRSNSMIIQEHGLTAHGDLHAMIEYTHGVKSALMDAPIQDTNAASAITVFWPNGKRMSCTPQVGGLAQGEDHVWWPNGQIAREAHFVRGRPDGVWKYFDQKGHPLGEGTFAISARQSGVFFGDDTPGANFFFTTYPMKKRHYEQGQLKKEEDWLKELEMP